MGVDDLFALFSVWGVDDLFALRFKIHSVQSIQSVQSMEGRRPVSTKIHSIQSVQSNGGGRWGGGGKVVRWPVCTKILSIQSMGVDDLYALRLTEFPVFPSVKSVDQG